MNLNKVLIGLAIFLSFSVGAEELLMEWGLENEWSYRKTSRTLEQDAAYHPQSDGEKYKTFAFIEGKKAVNDLRFPCFERHFELWDEYQENIEQQAGSAQPDRKEFKQFKREQDPTCYQVAKQLAPVLYFDFISSNSNQFILRAIEINTLRFSEYMGGGFSEKEAWYDIVLSHNEGVKRYDVSNRLTFTGNGRAELRLWSDNYYAKQGWIAPMGEYMIDIKFIFTSAGNEVTVSTGPFKIDV